MQKTNRRRFIKIAGYLAGATILPGFTLTSNAPTAFKKYIWNGTSLGADMGFSLIHNDKTKATKIINKALNELKRLESYFNIYESNSVVSRLNKEGSIKSPPAEFLDLISKSIEFGDLTDGYFDITVQSTWNKENPNKSLVNYKNIIVEDNSIYFKKRGMQITFNGIAQGYITDKIKDIFVEEGIENSLIELGEKYALGDSHKNINGWNVAIEGHNEVVALKNKAISTSSNNASYFQPNKNHILNPHTLKPENLFNSASIISDTATNADAISTAILSLNSLDRALKLVEHTSSKIFYW